MSGSKPKLNYSAIVRYLLDNPTCTSQEAGAHFGCGAVTIRVIAKKEGIRKEWAKSSPVCG